jgi:methylmalonyl-CoA mutase N-terminal domain/subunit
VGDNNRSGRARELRAAYDEAALQEGKELAGPFMTVSGEAINRLYDPTDVADIDYERDINLPGSYPFTRGVHKTGYRGKPWTIRMFSGFGSVEETNQRYKDLLAAGNNGLSIAFDMPTLMGYDHDEPWAEGEFGSCGVAVDHLGDMDILLSDLPLDRITTSMTINSPAAIIWAMYIAAAEKRGSPSNWAALRTTSSSMSPRTNHLLPRAVARLAQTRSNSRQEMPGIRSA